MMAKAIRLDLWGTWDRQSRWLHASDNLVPGWMEKILLGVLLSVMISGSCRAQCSSVASTPQAAADCAARATPQSKIVSLDASHPYSLAELIDIGEHNNPTRIAWERAKQKAESLGIAKSEYFPVLAGVAAFGDSRSILPFPAALVPPLENGRTAKNLPTLCHFH
jgi:outer membrane protein TolC